MIDRPTIRRGEDKPVTAPTKPTFTQEAAPKAAPSPSQPPPEPKKTPAEVEAEKTAAEANKIEQEANNKAATINSRLARDNNPNRITGGVRNGEAKYFWANTVPTRELTPEELAIVEKL